MIYIHGFLRGVKVDSTLAIDFLFGDGVVLTVDESLVVGTLNRLDQLLEMDVLECLLRPINGSPPPPPLPLDDKLLWWLLK